MDFPFTRLLFCPLGYSLARGAFGRNVSFAAAAVLLCTLFQGPSARASVPATASGAILANLPDAGAVTRTCAQRLENARFARGVFEALPPGSSGLHIIQAYDEAYWLLGGLSAESYLLKDTHPAEALREAGEACLAAASSELRDLSSSKRVYLRLVAAQRSGLPQDLRYAVARQIRSYELDGIGRPPAVQRRLADIRQEITAARAAYSRNIDGDIRYLEVRPEELDGLPADYLRARPPEAGGLVQISTAYADIQPIMRYGTSADLRSRVLLMLTNRGYPANGPVLERLLRLRSELARTLGFSDYPAYQFTTRMARDPAQVQRFIEGVASAARPRAHEELSIIRQNLPEDEGRALRPSDIPYAAGLTRERLYGLDSGRVRQYFRFPRVRDGLFRLVEELFGVEIRPANLEVWAADVTAYEMIERGKVIGLFYLDPHARSGKYTHHAMFPVRVGVQGRSVPVAALVTNFPTGLMEHGDAVTFLHEFGHLIHFLFAGQVDWAIQSTGSLEQDVLETPALLLEEWLWDEETLLRIGVNDAGEGIPGDLVRQMIAARRFGMGISAVEEAAYSAVALDLHTHTPPASDLSSFFRSRHRRLALVPQPENMHAFASFSHLVTYGAAYYTYAWSRALAEDLLSAFTCGRMQDRATATRYRLMILSRGGSMPMAAMTHGFLGRPWSVDRFLARLRGSPEARQCAALKPGMPHPQR